MMEPFSETMDDFNDQPLDDFQGLSPNQMQALIDDPFSESSPIKFNRNIPDEVFDKIPYFRLTEELLKILEASGKIKLTATQALPIKVIHELRPFKMPEPLDSYSVGKQMRELDSVVFTTLNITTRLLPFIKRQRNEFTFTKAGVKWLKTKDRHALLEELLTAFADKFFWGANDGYPELPIGQLAWGYTIFSLLKHGDTKRPVKFYSDLYFKAFPQLVTDFPPESYLSAEVGSYRAFSVRAISRFAVWFGFVEVHDNISELNLDHSNLLSADILPRIFSL